MVIRKLLTSAILLLGAVTLLVPGGIAFAGGAQTVGAAPVAITDAAVSPTTVTIPVGGSVLWTNHGAVAHQVVAARSKFKAFRLAPAGSNRVFFALAGVYPYTVDLKVGALVVVGVGIGAAASPSTSNGADNCGHPTIHHYDIRVLVHRYQETSWFGRSGTRISISDWKASWANAPMSMERCGGEISIGVPAGMVGPDSEHGLTTGQFDRKFDWNDTTSNLEGDAPCRFTVTNTVPAMTSLLAAWYAGSNGADFTFYAEAVHNNPDPSRELQRALDQQCDGRPGHRGLIGGWSEGETTSGTSAAFKPVNHVEFAITDANLVLTVPDATYSTTPFPLAVLFAGKGFNWDTGTLRTRITNKYGSDFIEDRAVVSFSPMPP